MMMTIFGYDAHIMVMMTVLMYFVQVVMPTCTNRRPRINTATGVAYH